MCGQVGDFAVSASHRSLGPAVLLQRATFDPVDNGVLAFVTIAPPHQAGMSTFRRLGIPANCKVHRFACPFAWMVSSGSGSAALRLYLPQPATCSYVSTVFCSESKGEKPGSVQPSRSVWRGISKLDEAVKGPDAIRGNRSATLLNWRYRENPLQQYETWTARRKGELMPSRCFA